MKTKRIPAAPSQVDLGGLPGARLRALLLAVCPAEAAEALDAQLADLHVEWLAAREHSSRAHAAWLALCIRAHLLTGAAYHATLVLGARALRAVLMVGAAGCITLGLFFGLATLIQGRAQDTVPVTPMPPWDVFRGELPPPPERKEPERTPRVQRPIDCPLCVIPSPVRDPGPVLPGRPDPFEVNFDPGVFDPTRSPPPALDRNFLCLPLVRNEPEYPSAALRRRIEGQVTVEVSIDRTGSVSDAEVLRAQPAGVFDDAVLRAVRRWRYRVPAQVETGCDRAQVMLRFELPR